MTPAKRLFIAELRWMENELSFQLQKKIEPGYWISQASKVDNKSCNAEVINEDLDTIKGYLCKIYNQLTATHKHVIGDMIKNAYTGKGQEKKTLMDVF